MSSDPAGPTAARPAAALPVVVRGEGHPVLCIHGSATDHATWTIQLGSLARHLRVIAYDRRGAPAAPLAAGEAPTTADHADDAAGVLGREARGPALVVGSSYGAVVALELALRHPGRVAGLVLCEPPLSAGPLVPRAPIGFGCALEGLAVRGDGADAVRMFLHAVLGDAPLARMPPTFRARSLACWPQIQADARALARWPLDAAALGRLATPVLLLGGDRSAPRFADALDALERILPAAARHTLVGAGHAMQIDQPRAFERHVRRFAAEVFGAPALAGPA